MLENPCKPDCPDRSATCHSTCEKYFIYDICKDHERNLRFKEGQIEDDIWATSRHSKKQKRRRAYADNRGGH